eukprot:PLAT6233.1.p2 GENE.PLAT6233.1~~PLAT6233.1.p2  ORF type:complete len:242 (+),score=104.89 PLAT6233.1:40-726(+)
MADDSSASSGKMTLTYFPLRYRRDHIAYLLEVGGVDYESEFISGTWAELKPTTPFGKLPLLKDGDLVIAQSNAIGRYVATKTGAMGSSAEETVAIDQFTEFSVEEIEWYHFRICSADESTLDAAKEKAKERLATWAAKLDEAVASNGSDGNFIVGSSFSLADSVAFHAYHNFMRVVAGDIPDGLPAASAWYAARLEQLRDYLTSDRCPAICGPGVYHLLNNPEDFKLE